MHLLTMGVVASTIRAKKYLLIPLVILAWIVLPTGTPEDLVTTIPLISYIGFTNYVLLCCAILFLLYVTGVWQTFYRKLRSIGISNIIIVVGLSVLVVYMLGMFRLQMLGGLI